MLGSSRTIEPLGQSGQPTETFAAAGKLDFGRDPLEYTHVPRAHTDGDAFVFFASAKVMHTGDLLFLGCYPWWTSPSAARSPGWLPPSSGWRRSAMRARASSR